MDRFPVMRKAQLDERQRALWDELTLGPRGFYTGGPETAQLPDLYNAWMHLPAFGELMLRLGDTIRDDAEMPGHLRELMVLTTSAELGALVEFDFHVPFAQSQGLTPEAIAALREKRQPDFTREDERLVHRANLELLHSGALSGKTREGLLDLVGHRGAIEMIAIIGLYAVTAWTTNIACVQLAEDFSADPEELRAFFAGRRNAE